MHSNVAFLCFSLVRILWIVKWRYLHENGPKPFVMSWPEWMKVSIIFFSFSENVCCLLLGFISFGWIILRHCCTVIDSPKTGTTTHCWDPRTPGRDFDKRGPQFPNWIRQSDSPWSTLIWHKGTPYEVTTTERIRKWQLYLTSLFYWGTLNYCFLPQGFMKWSRRSWNCRKGRGQVDLVAVTLRYMKPQEGGMNDRYGFQRIEQSCL